jgi:polar amino acid transport system substrate-binding protein
VGKSVFLEHDRLSGVFPELLADLEASVQCHFNLTTVPRARQEILFRQGTADVLAPASHSPERDKSGYFVPLIQVRALLIVNKKQGAALHSVAGLISQAGLKVGVVRGFDYGTVYQDLLGELQRQGRLTQDVDAVSIARLMKLGAVDATIMAPSIFLGSLETDARVAEMASKVRYVPLDEIPWSDSGLYLSRTSLQEPDRQILLKALEDASGSGAVWAAYSRHYSPTVMKFGFRPRKG